MIDYEALWQELKKHLLETERNGNMAQAAVAHAYLYFMSEMEASAERTVWLVLEMPVTTQDVLVITGVFDNEDAARLACVTPLHVMGPLALNTDYSGVDLLWPGAVYPTKPHQGDPCVYCGVPHDEVTVGNCPGR